METTILKNYMKKNVPDVRVGDSIKVHIKVIEGNKERVQIFEGLVIAAKHGKGIEGTYTVRKEFHGIGVERIFPLHSPRIIKVERIKQSKVRRSKLYFMRDLKGKHARMKELNRDYKMWEEPEAEEELAKKADAALASRKDSKTEEKQSDQDTKEENPEKASSSIVASDDKQSEDKKTE